jgi:hypothetical protein
MPTFNASAPASISARAASPVAMFPARTCVVFDCRLIRPTASIGVGMQLRLFDIFDCDQADAAIGLIDDQ